MMRCSFRRDGRAQKWTARGSGNRAPEWIKQRLVTVHKQAVEKLLRVPVEDVPHFEQQFA